MRHRLEGLGSLRWWWVAASIAAVGSFALAQPLFDLLGRNPAFFIARGFPAPDLVLLAVLLVAAPVVLALPMLVLRAVAPALGAVAHLLVMGGLFALAVSAALGSSPARHWMWVAVVAVAGGSGLGFAWAFLRFQPVQAAVKVASVAPAVFAVWFLVLTPLSGLTLGSIGTDLPERSVVADPFPVVMMVFDEFPLASIVHPDGSLDATHYPNFAELAADGVWYRDAIGVRQQTEEALPAILTGVAKDGDAIPTFADHPLNLFTALSGRYDVAAVENVTGLCADFICSNTSRRVDPFGVRWSALAVDVAVVYAHIVLPEELAGGLPPIDQTWGDFAAGERSDYDIIERFLDVVADDRRREVDRFLATFDRIGPGPPLRFAHVLYPHHPWDLLPDGRSTGATRAPGRDGVGWSDDAWMVAQGYQQHLLQVGYADTVLGRVVDRLVQEGIYDEALIVVLGDHGITVRPGTEHQRVITTETIGSIAHVPLFVKYPASFGRAPEPGTIDDERAETTDVVPTIADVVGVELPWEVGGLSLLDGGRAQRDGSVMVGTSGPVIIPAGMAEMLAVAEYHHGWFPAGDPWSLAPPGWRQVLGREAGGLAGAVALEATLDQSEALAAVDLGADAVPSFLSGTASFPGPVTGEEVVAVAVNGTVAVATRVYQPAGSQARFQAMVDPSYLRAGANEVVLWHLAEP